jgi:hypothetical protein
VDSLAIVPSTYDTSSVQPWRRNFFQEIFETNLRSAEKSFEAGDTMSQSRSFEHQIKQFRVLHCTQGSFWDDHQYVGAPLVFAAIVC